MFKVPLSDYKSVFYTEIIMPNFDETTDSKKDSETFADRLAEGVLSFSLTIEYNLKPTKEFDEWATSNSIKYILHSEKYGKEIIELFSESDYILFKLKWAGNA